MEIPVELAGLTPAIMLLVGGLRQAEVLSDRWTPLFALACGVAVAVVLAVTGELAWLPALVGGIGAGGAAVGLHQAVKQTPKPS